LVPYSRNLYHTFYMFYPYYHFWKTVLSFAISGNKPGEEFFLPADLSKVPVLFLYGTDKRAVFHNNRAVKLLQQEEKEEGDNNATEEDFEAIIAAGDAAAKKAREGGSKKKKNGAKTFITNLTY